MEKESRQRHREIQAQVLKILQGRDLIAKILLVLGMLATGFALVLLVIKALYWVILFLAGVVLLSGGMRKGS
jgi:hypothetical protein